MANATDCIECHLRCRPIFVPLTADKLAYIQQFKARELSAPVGSDVMTQSQGWSVLNRLPSGMMARSIKLPVGNRQVISAIFAGDLTSLQSGLMREARHCVTTVTDILHCHFSRIRAWGRFKNQTERANDLTRIAAMEEHFPGETVATRGRHKATEGVAWLRVRIWRVIGHLRRAGQANVISRRLIK